jgi:hypothetical protein
MELAIKLGKSLTEIRALPASELFEWYAFCSLKPEDYVSLEDQLRTVFGKPKDA